jgi:hypothetical protein
MEFVQLMATMANLSDAKAALNLRICNAIKEDIPKAEGNSCSNALKPFSDYMGDLLYITVYKL